MMKLEEYLAMCEAAGFARVEHNGMTLQTIEEAEHWGIPEWGEEPCYRAWALNVNEGESSDGLYHLYMVIWDIRADYNFETMSEEFACDWDTPARVTTQASFFDIEEERQV